MKPLIASLLLLIGSAMVAQSPPDRYIAQATTTAYTIQAPANNGRLIVFGDQFTAGAWVYCAAAQTATLSWNGTAATATTSATEIMMPGTQLPSGMTLWTGSNVGGGTTGPVYNIPAGVTFPISLFWLRLGMNGTGNNFTITTNGTCTITFSYSAT